MKKIVFTFLMLCSLSLSMASTVKKLSIDVSLRHDGSALITEQWHIVADDDITEWYLVEDHLGQMRIDSLQVVESGVGRFVTEKGEWDSDRSLSDKARRCGMITKGDGHYEICWGIGGAGDHQFAVSYVLHGLVKRYTDADGFNHMFVARDINCDFEDIGVTIHRDSVPFSADNTHIWAFGYEGSVVFQDGSIVARPVMSEWSSTRAVIVMCQFNKGIFQPSLDGAGTFSDVREEAMKNSSYDSSQSSGEDEPLGFWGWVFFGGLALVGFLFWKFMGWIALLFICSLDYIWWIVSLLPLRMYFRRKKLGEITWCHDIPFQGDLLVAKTVFDHYTYRAHDIDKQDIAGAMVLRLVYQGSLSIVSGSGKNKKSRYALQVNDLKSGASKEEQMAYNLMKEAAGENKVLEYGELKDYIEHHTSEAEKFFDRLNRDAEYPKSDLDNQRKVLGLKKYLNEFTLVDERSMEEVKLWKEYLVYAQLFGIARRVRKQLKTVWPEFYTLAAEEDETDYMRSTYFTSFVSSGMSSAASAGSGGSSSVGGGGGFSGGGSGGGGR